MKFNNLSDIQGFNDLKQGAKERIRNNNNNNKADLLNILHNMTSSTKRKHPSTSLAKIILH